MKNLDCFGPCQIILDHFYTLSFFGPFGPYKTGSAILDHSRPFGPFWTILDRLDHFGPFGPFGPFWTIWTALDHFGPFYIEKLSNADIYWTPQDIEEYIVLNLPYRVSRYTQNQ